ACFWKSATTHFISLARETRIYLADGLYSRSSCVESPPRKCWQGMASSRGQSKSLTRSPEWPLSPGRAEASACFNQWGRCACRARSLRLSGESDVHLVGLKQSF